MLATLNLVQGDDFFYDFVVAADDGSAVDITGWRFWLTVKRSPFDADSAALFQLTTDGGGIVTTDAAAGRATAHGAASLTGGVAGRYVWDLRALDAAANTSTPARGILTLAPRVGQALS